MLESKLISTLFLLIIHAFSGRVVLSGRFLNGLQAQEQSIFISPLHTSENRLIAGSPLNPLISKKNLTFTSEFWHLTYPKRGDPLSVGVGLTSCLEWTKLIINFYILI